MKKFLLFIIFLLTLFPLLGMVDGSTIMAQHWTYEDGSNWLPDLEVGSNNERCDECGHFYDPEEGHECWYKCEYCYEIVSDLNRHYKYSQACAIAAGYKEEDDEPKNGFCCICSLPIDQCTCTGGIGIGNRPSGGGGYGNGGSSGSLSDVTITIPVPSVDKNNSPSEDGQSSSGTSYVHACPCLVTLSSAMLKQTIDWKYDWDELNDSYFGLVDGLKRHIAFPETIQQGNNATCASALIQKFFAENYPEQYIDCVYNLAKYGRYPQWGLEIPQASQLSGITEYELSEEDSPKVREERKKYGVNYTAVDALMQTAIQNNADNNTFLKSYHKKLTGYVYSVLSDFGDSGGMSFYDELDFLYANLPYSDVSFIKTPTRNKEDVINVVNSYDPDSYTIIASIYTSLEANSPLIVDKSKYLLFVDPPICAHALEITGSDDGNITFWTWAQNRKFTESVCPVNNYIMIKKSKYAKDEKKIKKDMHCDCRICFNTACDICM